MINAKLYIFICMLKIIQFGFFSVVVSAFLFLQKSCFCYFWLHIFVANCLFYCESQNSVIINLNNYNYVFRVVRIDRPSISPIRFSPSTVKVQYINWFLLLLFIENIQIQLSAFSSAGFGRCGQPTKHSPHSLQLWFTRFALLVKLGLFNLCQREAEAFGCLNKPDMYFEVIFYYFCFVLIEIKFPNVAISSIRKCITVERAPWRRSRSAFCWPSCHSTTASRKWLWIDWPICIWFVRRWFWLP